MPAFTLYGARGSANTDRVRFTIAEGGIKDYDFVLLDLSKGEQKSEENLARHPWGKVPSLVTSDGLVLYESRAICKYLSRKYDLGLIPSDDPKLSLFEQAESTESLLFAEPAGQIAFEKVAKRFKGFRANETVVASALQAIEAFLDVVEQLLSRREYIAGDDFTLVDIYYIPPIRILFMAGYGDIVLSRKAVSAWWSRCVNRPAIQKVIAADKEAADAAAKK